jgi:hypothetical protein
MTKQTPVTEDEVGKRIIDVLNAADIDDATALIALFNVIQCVLASIQCPDCRQTAANSMRELFPKVITEALKAPSERVHLH